MRPGVKRGRLSPGTAITTEGKLEREQTGAEGASRSGRCGTPELRETKSQRMRRERGL